MFVRKSCLGVALAGSVLSLGSLGAHAASGPIVTGVILAGDDDDIRCSVVNATNKEIIDTVVRIRDVTGDIHISGCNTDLDALSGCSVGSTGDSGLFFCEITSDRGAKGLRGTLVNTTTGASSDAR